MSLQVCVPCGCPNQCKFCVSRMHENQYPNLIGKPKNSRIVSEYMRRLQFARDNHYQSIVITGTGEPLTNSEFLVDFAGYNKTLASPFQWIEIQTSGILLKEHFKFLRETLGVSTICLSVCDITNCNLNNQIMGIPEEHQFVVKELCEQIKEEGFNLRLSMNMWSVYNNMKIDDIMYTARILGTDQLTFKLLYTSDENTPQANWIRDNQFTRSAELYEYIENKGVQLEVLPFGATRYDVQGMSVVIDKDCMSKNAKQIRYLILRPNCHLYTRWDNKGSLLF